MLPTRNYTNKDRWFVFILKILLTSHWGAGGDWQPWKFPSGEQHREKTLVFRDRNLGIVRFHRSPSGRSVLQQCHDSQHCFTWPVLPAAEQTGFTCRKRSVRTRSVAEGPCHRYRPTGWTSNYNIPKAAEAWFKKIWHTEFPLHISIATLKYLQFTLRLSKTDRTHQLSKTPITILQP